MLGRNRFKPMAGHWSTGALITLSTTLGTDGELATAHVSLWRPVREVLHESWSYERTEGYRSLAGTGLTVSRLAIEAVEQYRFMGATDVLVVHDAPATIGAVRADLAVRECEPWAPRMNVLDVAVLDSHMLGYRPSLRSLGACADQYGVQCGLESSAPVRTAELLIGSLLALHDASGDVACLSAPELVTAQKAWVTECVNRPGAWPYECGPVTQAQVRAPLSLRNLFS